MKDRRLALQSEVRDVLRRGGNVLLPVDSAGRVLELVILLEEFWQSEPELARAHPLFLCGQEAHRMLEMAANNVIAMKRRIREREDSARCVAVMLRAPYFVLLVHCACACTAS